MVIRLEMNNIYSFGNCVSIFYSEYLYLFLSLHLYNGRIITLFLIGKFLCQRY